MLTAKFIFFFFIPASVLLIHNIRNGSFNQVPFFENLHRLCCFLFLAFFLLLYFFVSSSWKKVYAETAEQCSVATQQIFV